MTSADQGWSATNNALASPADYFEATFSAATSTTYHVWVRMRAGSNSKWNDSVYVQFSDAVDQNGQAAYRVGTTNGLIVNLATDATGGSLSNWGWMDHGYWVAQSPDVQFAGSGSHTIRVQTREDGVQVDEIVLSPSTYLTNSPGSPTADTNIVYKPSSGGSGALSPFLGSPVTLPGTVEAENFDNGGEGVAYHDTTPGNAGGQYRSTDVDIEASSGGGYDVGWTAAGEWLNYTVKPSSAGAYTVHLRVASASGGTLHVGFNSPSNVWTAVPVPATGGWQTWQTVTMPATLAAGTQQITVMFDTGGVNLDSITVSSGSGASSGSGSSSSSGLSPYSGTPVAIPGTVEAENFDNGGEGVAYHDTTPGNAGLVYRSTDVDIEAASSGGYDVGWTAAGEWLNYTVNVASAGSYTVQLLVASSTGGTLHVGFNTASNVWTSVNVPSTGGWQSWSTVSVPVALGAGTQQITVMFDTGGVNLNSITVVSGTSSVQSSGGGTSSGSGGSASTVNVAEWNIQINDGSDAHARLAMDDLMAISPRPQIVVIEEGWTSLFNTYIDELQRQTGQTWHGAWATMCDPGQWNGSSCNTQSFEGIGIFTTYAITSTSSILMPYVDCYTSARPSLRAALNVNGTTLQVFGAHLQTGGCDDDAQSRYNSMSLIKSWASNYPAPQIAAGDFNADPDQIDTTAGMVPTFVDTWSVAGSGRGFSAFTPTPSMKIDYWFEDN
ncbi:MAG TPA: carbohydrate-binding protein, partial [Vicinamibacterales bacterium]|nr:carbohydrate-binding protein [Vicinamibacterales bacterium]